MGRACDVGAIGRAQVIEMDGWEWSGFSDGGRGVNSRRSGL